MADRDFLRYPASERMPEDRERVDAEPVRYFDRIVGEQRHLDLLGGQRPRSSVAPVVPVDQPPYGAERIERAVEGVVDARSAVRDETRCADTDIVVIDRSERTFEYGHADPAPPAR